MHVCNPPPPHLPPQEKRGLLICFPGSSLKGEQDTLEALSDLLPHPSLTFLSLLHLSFRRSRHLSLAPSAFSPRFSRPPIPMLSHLLCWPVLVFVWRQPPSPDTA